MEPKTVEAQDSEAHAPEDNVQESNIASEGSHHDAEEDSKNNSPVALQDKQQRQYQDKSKPQDDRDYLLAAEGTPFAHKSEFWTSLLCSSIPQGILMALIALGFFNCYVAINEATWLTDEYQEALDYNPPPANNNDDAPSSSSGDDAVLDPLRLGNGKWWYIGLLAGGGAAVGLLQVVWNCLVPKEHAYPTSVPGFVADVRDLAAHDAYLPVAIIMCSALSLGCGASVGPEMALGAVGTALGSCWFGWGGDRRRQHGTSGQGDDDDGAGGGVDSLPPTQQQDNWFTRTTMCYCRPSHLSGEPELCALDGITAAFGALFPSQFLSCLIAIELGLDAWRDIANMQSHPIMEIVARTALASSVAYVLFTGLEDRTLLEFAPIAGEEVVPEIKAIHMLYALVLGVLAGFFGLLGLLLLGVFKKAGTKLRSSIDRISAQKFGCSGANGHIVGTIMTPALGGVVLGLLYKAVPLLLGDGEDQLGVIIGASDELGLGTIVAAGFLKLVTVSISLGFGFVGGQIFPLIFAGTCMGAAAHLIVEEVPVLVAIPCCMVALPCAFIPAVFTFTLLSSLAFALGGAATTPVFLACAVSYTMVAGLGVVHRLVMSAKAREVTVAKDASDNEEVET